MKLRMFQKEWHGIDLREIRAVHGRHNELPTPEFYAEFYRRLMAEKADINGAWAANKQEMGTMVREAFLLPWETKTGRKPSILAMGAGLGYVEMDWLERNYDVTLQECQSSSLCSVVERYQGAKVLIGDAQTMVIDGKYDVVTVFGLDYALARNECVDLLKACRRCLSDDGIILLYSVNTLSCRQVAVEVIKTIAGSYRNDREVFWGWWRSLGEYAAIARDSGMSIENCYLMDGRNRGASFRQCHIGLSGLHLRGANSVFVMK